MSIQIAVENIDVPPQWRKVKKAGVGKLADSMASDGLLHPIGVRPDEATGRYVLVFGRHRLEAARQLKWREIDASLVAPGLPDSTYQGITHAENLFRTELSPAERIIALKKWQEGYLGAHPEVEAAARQRAAAEATNRKRAPGDAAESDPAASGESPVAPPVPTFAEHVAAVTGMEWRTVRAYLTTGKNLTEEQLLVFAQAQVPHDQLKRIARLKPDQVAEVAALVASGCNVQEAIAEATLPPGATSQVVGDPEGPRHEADLSDEDWVAQQCGEVLERLKKTAVYVTDAILYRRVRDARNALRTAAKKPLALARKASPGPFTSMLARVANVDHPKNWSPCGPCGASGGDAYGPCDTCKGDGFLLRKESR